MTMTIYSTAHDHSLIFETEIYRKQHSSRSIVVCGTKRSHSEIEIRSGFEKLALSPCLPSLHSIPLTFLPVSKRPAAETPPPSLLKTPKANFSLMRALSGPPSRPAALNPLVHSTPDTQPKSLRPVLKKRRH